jgi:hypothetical protein
MPYHIVYRSNWNHVPCHSITIPLRYKSRLVLAVSRKLEQNTSKGVSRGDAWNICSVELVRAAQVQCLSRFIVKFHLHNGCMPVKGLWWRNRASKSLSPLRTWVSPLRTWVWFSLRTHVKRVCQRSAESRGFSPGAPVSSHRKSWQGGLG